MISGVSLQAPRGFFAFMHIAGIDPHAAACTSSTCVECCFAWSRWSHCQAACSHNLLGGTLALLSVFNRAAKRQQRQSQSLTAACRNYANHIHRLTPQLACMYWRPC